MFLYQVRIAWKSLLRNPVLSILLVAGIAMGIAVASVFVTAYYIFSGNPIPHKSDRLYYVELDSWNPQRAWDEDNPQRAPNQLTYIDTRGIEGSDIPTHQTAMFQANMTVQPKGEDLKPYREDVRMCRGDFFRMFDVPFLYGGPWGASADDAPDPVVVIDAETNRKLFGGENSVGRPLTLDNRNYTIVGVLDEWRPNVKFYDPTQGASGDPEKIFMPFNHVEPLRLTTSGNTNGWKFTAGNQLEDFWASEDTWLQYWVQLDSRAQKEEYKAFLDAYATEQKKLGRFQRPLNNKVLSVMEWLEDQEVVPESSRTMLIIALLFLLVSSVNLIGILLGKFLSRAPEIGVRRALGASRRSVFIQHIVECELVGVLGGILGLGLSVIALKVINRMFENQTPFVLDFNMVAAALFLSLVAGLVAGVYPAWRICRVAPARYLKLQ
jgi:putative ABC transport system permease protein